MLDIKTFRKKTPLVRSLKLTAENYEDAAIWLKEFIYDEIPFEDFPSDLQALYFKDYEPKKIYRYYDHTSRETFIPVPDKDTYMVIEDGKLTFYNGKYFNFFYEPVEEEAV